MIKSDDRDRYISGLQNADVGRMLPLAEFMLANVQWSLALATRAAKGESIEEPRDIDKEIALFVRRNRGSAADASDIEVLDNVFSFSVRPTLDKLEGTLEPLRQLFNDSHWGSYLKTAHNQVKSMTLFDNGHWESTKQSYVARPGFKFQDQQQVELRRELRFSYYVGSGTEGFSVNLSVIWQLGREGFSFDAAIDERFIASVSQSIPYSELDAYRPEVERTVDSICKSMMNEIEHRSQQPKRARINMRK